MSVKAWGMAFLVMLAWGANVSADAPKSLNPDSAVSSSKELEEAIRALSKQKKGIQSLNAECEMEEEILPTSWLPKVRQGEPDVRKHQFAIRWMEGRWLYRWKMQFPNQADASRSMVISQEAACNGATFESLMTFQGGDRQASVRNSPQDLKKHFWESWEAIGFGLTGRTHRWNEGGARNLMRFLSVLDLENFEQGSSNSTLSEVWYPLSLLQKSREKGLTVVSESLQGKRVLLVKGTQDLGGAVQEFQIRLNPERNYLPSRWVRITRDSVLKNKVFNEETFTVSEWADVEGFSFPVRMEDALVEVKEDGTRIKRREIKATINPRTLRVNRDLDKASYHVSYPLGMQINLPQVSKSGDRSNRVTIIGIPWEFTDRHTHNLLNWTIDFVLTGNPSWLPQQLRWLVIESVVFTVLVVGVIWGVMRWRKRKVAAQKSRKSQSPGPDAATGPVPE